jgi:cytochrome c-type biogenesis protein CcmE
MAFWPKSRRARQRLMIVAGVGVALALAVALALNALRDTVVFFFGPSQIPAEMRTSTRDLRIGGLVKQGSVQRAGDSMRFVITDLKSEVAVTYTGIVPDLFREGQGVVAQGSFDPSGVLNAHTILAKHDETYMPREVKNALKDAGEWRGTQ